MKYLKKINELYGSSSTPNPRKTINVNFNIDNVKKAVLKISGDYKLVEEDDILNQYKFDNYEFLNLGSYAFINLDEINENRTSITIEIIRKVGSFNIGAELNKANNHINSLFTIISKYLKNPDLFEKESDLNIGDTWNNNEISLLEKNDFEKKNTVDTTYYRNEKEGIDIIKKEIDDDIKLRNLVNLSGEIDPVGKKIVFQYKKKNPNYKSMKFIKRLVTSDFYESGIFDNLSDCIKDSMDKKF